MLPVGEGGNMSCPSKCPFVRVSSKIGAGLFLSERAGGHGIIPCCAVSLQLRRILWLWDDLIFLSGNSNPHLQIGKGMNWPKYVIPSPSQSFTLFLPLKLSHHAGKNQKVWVHRKKTFKGAQLTRPVMMAKRCLDSQPYSLHAHFV